MLCFCSIYCGVARVIGYVPIVMQVVRTMQDKRDNSDRKQIRFGELLDKINAVRGDMPFAAWVKQACEEKLASLKKGS